jgi:hypothetical protein
VGKCDGIESGKVKGKNRDLVREQSGDKEKMRG